MHDEQENTEQRTHWTLRLITFAIPTVLALWFFVSCANQFREAHWRDQKGRIKGGQRNLATALESYLIDHEAYPPEGKPFEAWGANPKVVTKADAQYFLAPPASVTTPIAYLRSIPRVDQLGSLWWRNTITPPAYLRVSGEPRYFLISPGPDCVFDVRPEHFSQIQDGIHHDLAHLIYDPSNGTFSGGDIMRSHLGVVQPIRNKPRANFPSAEPSDLILTGPKP